MGRICGNILSETETSSQNQPMLGGSPVVSIQEISHGTDCHLGNIPRMGVKTSIRVYL